MMDRAKVLRAAARYAERYAQSQDAIRAPAVVQEARAAGASVCNTHRVGGGFVDQVWGIAGLNLLVEIKTPAGRLNDNERQFHQDWRGQIAVVRTVEEAVALVERWREFGYALGELAREMEL